MICSSSSSISNARFDIPSPVERERGNAAGGPQLEPVAEARRRHFHDPCTETSMIELASPTRCRDCGVLESRADKPVSYSNPEVPIGHAGGHQDLCVPYWK